jgi:DNA replication protein
MSKSFEGFPAGSLSFISVPDLFFTGLVPLIDDLAELKVVLHMIWLRQRHRRQVVCRDELEADETLLRGLAGLDDNPTRCLAQALARAVQRGALLHAIVPAGQTGDDETSAPFREVYALNSEGGRQAMTAVQNGQLALPDRAVGEPSPSQPRANIYKLYEDTIGLLSPILAEELQEVAASYPAEWIEEAFRLAAADNVRKWRYVRAILERWATRGRGDAIDQRHPEAGQRWYTDEEFETYFEH